MLEHEFEELIKGGGAKASGGGAPAGVLTPRERFRRCMHYQTVDRVPHWEFGYWKDTIKRFHREGLPAQYDTNDKVETYFGCEHAAYVGGDLGTRNHREAQVVEVRGDVTIRRDSLGVLMEVNTSGADSIPHYLEFPIRDRASWIAFRDEFLPVDLDARVPADIARRGAELLRSDVPVGVGFGSYLGWVRNWIGFENLAMMFYDDLALVEEIVAHNATIILRVLERVLPHVSADFACGWEDICYNSGPLCSPEMFDRVVMPYLRPVLSLLRRHGITVIYTDCDGDVSKLTPLWLAAGQNCMFPIEVRGGTDPVKLRQEYGREALLIGGVDKMALLRGREGVLEELKRIAPVVEDGGFIPHVDHRVQGDVPYDIYRYYVREKLSMLGWKREEIAAVEPLRNFR